MKKDENQVIFPFQVDVPSFPERRWVRASRNFAYIACINIFFCILFSFLLLLFSNSKNTIPVFLYFSDSTNKFEKLDFQELTSQEKSQFSEEGFNLFQKEISNQDTGLSQKELAQEQFIKDYLETRYNVSTFAADNNYKWCDCIANEDEQSIQMSYVKREQAKCSLCTMSEPVVFSEFKTKEMNLLATNAKRLGNSHIEIEQIKEFLKASRQNTKDKEYTIFEVIAKITFDNLPNPVYQKYFIGVSEIATLNEKRIKDEERPWVKPQPFLFKVVSFSVTDFVRAK
jgi:hypothetical protein